MVLIPLGWRMFLRDWRAGELRLLMAALALAVAAIACVSFLADRMRQGLLRDAAQLLGADLVINSDHAPSSTLLTQAAQRHLRVAQTITFPSMALRADAPTEKLTETQRSALVAVKAVSSGYPLRGQVKLSRTMDSGAESVTDIPAPGTVWVDAALLQQLNATLGDRLFLGERAFSVARVIQLEPDRGANFLSFAPRVMLRMDELAATGLQQPGSRMTYRVLLAGETAQIKSYQDWFVQNSHLQPEKTAGQQIETLESGRPEMRVTLERAEHFLALIACLSTLLAALAVGMAARRFTQRHVDACGVLRCLGARQHDLLCLFLIEFSVLAVLAIAFGIAIGAGAHFALAAMLAPLMGAALPAPTLQPLLQAAGTGALLLFGFAMPPLLQLRTVAPLRVLRREAATVQISTLLWVTLSCAAFAAMLLWQAGAWEFGVKVVSGFLASAVVLWGASWGVLWLMQASGRLLAGRLGPAWHQAFIHLKRRRAESQLQLLVLAVGLLALILLTTVRADLLRSWHAALAPDAPNRFLLNIQPDQHVAVEQFFAQQGLPAPQLYPMVRGRLMAINDQVITRDRYADARAQRLVNREFNLSYMDQLPAHNRIVAGHWQPLGGEAADEISLESGLAETLGLKLGDQLRFDIAGQPVQARVGSLRKLDWDSLRVNFFVIFPPALLQSMPQTHITAFYLPESDRNFQSALVQSFPNLTLLDTGHIIRQVQVVLEQMLSAVQFLFLFTLASGLMVIYAALVSSQDQRQREAALLRVLGASTQHLRRVQRIELILLGSWAGGLAAVVANAAAWFLAEKVFNLVFHFNLFSLLLGIGLGIMCTISVGWLGLRPVLSQPPLRTLGEL